MRQWVPMPALRLNLRTQARGPRAWYGGSCPWASISRAVGTTQRLSELVMTTPFENTMPGLAPPP